jgi:hypothetical protein
MRSDLIFCAVTRVTNRYQLCRLAAEATRKLHKPNTRTQDTTNNVLILMRDRAPRLGPRLRRGRHSCLALVQVRFIKLAIQPYRVRIARIWR